MRVVAVPNACVDEAVAGASLALGVRSGSAGDLRVWSDVLTSVLVRVCSLRLRSRKPATTANATTSARVARAGRRKPSDVEKSLRHHGLGTLAAALTASRNSLKQSEHENRCASRSSSGKLPELALSRSRARGGQSVLVAFGNSEAKYSRPSFSISSSDSSCTLAARRGAVLPARLLSFVLVMTRIDVLRMLIRPPSSLLDEGTKSGKRTSFPEKGVIHPLPRVVLTAHPRYYPQWGSVEAQPDSEEWATTLRQLPSAIESCFCYRRCARDSHPSRGTVR